MIFKNRLTRIGSMNNLKKQFPINRRRHSLIYIVQPKEIDDQLIQADKKERNFSGIRLTIVIIELFVQYLCPRL